MDRLIFHVLLNEPNLFLAFFRLDLRSVYLPCMHVHSRSFKRQGKKRAPIWDADAASGVQVIHSSR